MANTVSPAIKATALPPGKEKLILQLELFRVRKLSFGPIVAGRTSATRTRSKKGIRLLSSPKKYPEARDSATPMKIAIAITAGTEPRASREMTKALRTASLPAKGVIG